MRDLVESPATTVRREPACGMVTLRGPVTDPDFAEALERIGIVVPARRQMVDGPAGRTLWMSPDELLVLGDAGTDAALAARASDALSGRHHLAVAVGDARARFAITGPGARVALAKLCPADMAIIARGEVRRTRLAQAAAAFWMTDDAAFDLVCFRSVADYVEAALTNAVRHSDGLALP